MASTTFGPDKESSLRERERMVELQLARRGISDPRVLDAFRAVPREAFLPPELAEFAYRDTPLPIAAGQTISQPYIVAVTVEALGLRGAERVLEIGTGSGYAAAILGRLAKEVFTIERLEPLADEAGERLARLGYRNVHVLCADGTLGWPDHAPYDAIAVAAGGPELPKALLAQLAPGGRLVIPVGPDVASQELVRVVREGNQHFRREPIMSVRFVPLIGEQGWPEEGGVIRKVMKRSEGKGTWPGAKQVWRSDEGGIAAGDLISLNDEPAPSSARALLEPVMRVGRRVTPQPSLEEARWHCRRTIGALPSRLRGLAAEATYPITRSAALATLTR